MNWFRDHAPPPPAEDPFPHRQALDDLRDLLKEAAGDLSSLGKIAEDTREQWAMRGFIRAVFALIEGVVFAMKQTALVQHTWFTHAELAVLREETPQLNDKGQVTVAPMNLNLARNIRFAFEALSRSLKGQNALNVDGHRWATFQRSVKVRNRLMHPKTVMDLRVTYEEMREAGDVFGWFNALFGACYTAHIRRTAAEQPMSLEPDEEILLQEIERDFGRWLD